ncbi:MAG: hypothetical protein ABIZ04_21105 [Opitutus sp.]
MTADSEPPINPPPPPVNWDRVLQWSAAAIVVVTVLGIISRRRSLLIAAELIDFLIIVALFGLAIFALIAKSNKKTK